MDIKLNEEELQEAINSKMNKAVENALMDYSIQKVIAEKITQSFACGVIGEALDKALASMDVTELTTVLAKEISKATTRAAVHILTDGLIETLLNLRKIPDYDDKKRSAARMELAALLKRE